MVARIHMPYELDIPYPVDRAYAWLTDYDAADGERAGAIVKERRPVETREDVVVLHGHIQTLGRDTTGKAEVHLDPPDHWTAHLYDEKGRLGDIYDYRLTPGQAAGTSQLSIDYGFVAPKLKHKLMLTFAKPLIRRELDKMWAGFLSSMRAELG